MGYELINFVGEIDKEFVCPICFMVVVQPMVSPCEHIFCKSCIDEWIALEAICPVDRLNLCIDDLNAPPRFYRNLWNKLEVRCEMEHFGCTSTIKLENLESHRANCIYKPETILVCDKGCNLTMTRLEYQKPCVDHLASNFSIQVRAMKNKINELNSQLRRQREAITRLIRGTGSLLELNWEQSHNMKVSDDDPNVMELIHPDPFCFGFAQFNHLDRTNPFFRIRVLNLVESAYVVVGLTHKNHMAELPGRNVGSIGYYSRGELVVNGKAEFGYMSWDDEDIVEWGVIYPNVPTNAEFTFGEVYFKINSHLIVKKRMKIPSEGFFPTIRIGSFSSSVPKIEHLSFQDA